MGGWIRYAAALPLVIAGINAAGAQAPGGHAGPHPGDLHHGHHQPPPDMVAPWLVDPFLSTYRPLPRQDTLIVHATILDGAGGRIDGGSVLVRDGRVAAISAGTIDSHGAKVIDAHGRWLTPGIIDVHSHDGTYVVPLTTIDEQSSDVSELSDPDAADTWIQTAINPQDPAFVRALAGGVTTMQVLPGSDPVFGGRSIVLKPIPEPTVAQMAFPDAPRGLKMACGENPKSTDAAMKRGPTSRQGEIAYIRATLTEAQRYEGEWNAYLSGHEDDRPKDDGKLDTLVELLHGRINAHIHCYRADEMAVMIALSHEFGFRIAAFHHAEEGYKIASLLRREDICAAVWPDWWGYKMEAADGIRENAAFIDAAGGCVMMHSDSPQVGQWLNIDAAKAMAAGRRAGLTITPEHAIRWLTANPARALGLADRIGTIAPGKDADLVLWSGDPFSVYAHADLVLIDGAVAWDRSDPAHQPRSDFELGRPQEPRP